MIKVFWPVTGNSGVEDANVFDWLDTTCRDADDRRRWVYDSTDCILYFECSDDALALKIKFGL